MLAWLSFNGRILLYLYLLRCIILSVKSGSDIISDHNPGECVFEYSSTLISQGEVYSPNYPNSYPNNLNCRYEFYARDNERVIIQVDDFELEPAQTTNIQDIHFMDFIETITRPNGNRKNSELPTTHSAFDPDRGSNLGYLVNLN